MSPGNLREWFEMRSGNVPLLPEIAQARRLTCNLSYLLQNWYFVRRFVLNHRCSYVRDDAASKNAFINDIPGHLDSLLKNTCHWFTVSSRASRELFKTTPPKIREWLTSDWGSYSSHDSSEVVGRFMYMQCAKAWWPELVEKYREELAAELQATPAVYFGLKDAGYKVDEWLGERRFFDFAGKLKKQLMNFRREEAVAEHWCGPS